MFFQLNDATGADSFTLDSREFLVLGGIQNTTSTSPNPTLATTVTASSTHTSSASPGSPAKGLSQAGKVGVGIGVPFAVISLGLLAFLILKLKSRKGNTDGFGMNQQRSELESATKQSYRNTVSSYGGGQTTLVAPYEVHGGEVRSEMPEK
jgi:hypothetical protein